MVDIKNIIKDNLITILVISIKVTKIITGFLIFYL